MTFETLELPSAGARNVALRFEVMIRIEAFVGGCQLTRARAAPRPGVTQLRPNALLRGKIDRFSLQALVEIATRAGVTAAIRVAQ